MVPKVLYHFGKETGGVWLEAGSVPAKKVVKNGKDLYYNIYIYLTKLGFGIIILPILSPNCFRIRIS